MTIDIPEAASVSLTLIKAAKGSGWRVVQDLCIPNPVHQ